MFKPTRSLNNHYQLENVYDKILRKPYMQVGTVFDDGRDGGGWVSMVTMVKLVVRKLSGYGSVVADGHGGDGETI